MRPRNFKGGRYTKRKLKKCEEIVRTYDKIQTKYADKLDRDENIKSIRVNVVLEGLDEGEFTSDFVCTKTDGDLMVRECVFRILTHITNKKNCEAIYCLTVFLVGLITTFCINSFNFFFNNIIKYFFIKFFIFICSN